MAFYSLTQVHLNIKRIVVSILKTSKTQSDKNYCGFTLTSFE